MRWLSAIMMLAVVVGGRSMAQQRPTFQSEARLVVLQATVKNDRGELVTDLSRDVFTVYEDGKRQRIAIFRKDDAPVSIGLLIDNSGSMRQKRAKVEATALAFVRASNPLNEVFVINFADKLLVDVDMTSDIRALEAGIARVDSIGGTAMRDAIDAGERYLLGTRSTIAGFCSSSPTATTTRARSRLQKSNGSRSSAVSRSTRSDS